MARVLSAVLLGCSAAACALATSGPADAGEPEALAGLSGRPATGVELTDAVYAGVGLLPAASGARTLSGAGVAAESALGIRFGAHWAALGVLSYQEINPDWMTNARGVALGASFAYLAGGERFEPWIHAGAGYRLLWEQREVGGATLLDSGVELIRVEGGVDLRISPGVAVAPVLGASVDWLPRASESARPAANVICSFGYFGLQLRLDPFAAGSLR